MGEKKVSRALPPPVVEALRRGLRNAALDCQVADRYAAVFAVLDDLVEDGNQAPKPGVGQFPPRLGDAFAAVAFRAPEMLQRIVGGLDRLAPGAEQRLPRARAV